MYSFDNCGLDENFGNCFCKIASGVRKQSSRKTFIVKIPLTKIKASLGQLSLMGIGTTLWSEISENVKSHSSFQFAKQYKNVVLPCHYAS